MPKLASSAAMGGESRTSRCRIDIRCKKGNLFISAAANVYNVLSFTLFGERRQALDYPGRMGPTLVMLLSVVIAGIVAWRVG